METRRRRALIESFEPRIMYSADPGPAGLAAAVLTAAELQVDGGEALQGAGIELVFVDARVPELQLLLDDLAAQQQAGRAIEVVVIGGGDDGIAVVGESLAGRDDVTAIHLIGHGAAGVADLGASRLNAGSLALRAGEIAAWGDALTAEADLLIYGCEVASTAAGEGLVDALAALTGADVAASDGLTGAAGLGGDWDLEYRSGGIETTLAPGVALQQAWGGVLAISTSGAVTSASSADANSLTWSHTVASGTDVALFVEIAMRNSGTHAQTVKYGVQDLTWVGDLDSNQGVVEIWRLLSPTPGTANVVVSLSANTAVAAGATTYNGVNQSSPVRNFYGASGTGITGSVTVSDSAVGDLVIDVQSWRGEPTGGTLGEKQLQNWSRVVAGSNGLTSKSTRESGDVSVVMSGSYTSSADWVIGAVAIRPAALNSAPVLNASKSPTLTTIAEDAGAPSGAVGTLVSSLVDFASPAGQVDNVTDADPGALTGIAVTATNTSAGSWWYSLNNGGNWLAMGSVSEASARLLSADAGTRLYFQSNANWNGSLADAITFRAWDRSNGANGDLASAASTGGISAFSSVSDTASLTVSAVNDAPAITFVSGNANYPENAGPVIVAPAATVSDVDSTDFAGGRLEVYFSANGQPEDRIGIRNEGTGAGQIGLSGSDVTYGGVVIGSWSGGTSGTTPLIVSFNANATAVSAQALGRNITYQNVSDTPSTQVRTLVGYLVDGDGGTSNIVGGTLTIVPANDAPVAVITPASYTATEQVALALSGTGISVSDADAGTAVIHATLSVVSGTLSGVEGSTGVTLAGSGTSSLTVDGTLAQINAFLAGDSGASLSYRIDTDVPPASDTFTLTVDDLGYSGGPAQTGTDTATINITAVNDGPANHVPGVQVTALDTAVIMRAADGNGLSITDPDTGSALMRVALSATSGTLTLGTTAGLATVSGDGTASVIVTGTLAAINTALDGLRFTPTGGFTGTASFVVETSDQGNTGGGALTDTDTVFIKVGASRFQQGVDSYSGTEDTYVSDGASTTSYGNATTVVTDDGSPLNQGLLRFGNLFGSGVGQIPLGAVINSVTLSFYVTHTDANDSVSIYRMLSAWDESSTWSGLGSGVSLNGSEAASSPDVANWDSGISGWNTITSGLKASVQAWANGETNNGWVFNSLSPAADNWTFASSEYATVSQRPYLVISYTPPAPPVITSNGGGATASVVMAENGTYVTTVTATDADSAQGALRYFIAGADSDKFSIDSSGVLSFKVAPDYEAPSDVGSNRVYDLTVRVSDGSVEDTQDIAVTVTAVNEAPAFTGLGGSVSHTEGGSASVLAGAVTLSDPELSAADSFGGATLALARSGGANAEDVFSATGQLAPLAAGESLLLGGVAVGTVNVNAGGTLSLSFNANANRARINEVLQSIAYTNTSNTPPASVGIGWTFNDGNAGGQGAGGALSASGSSTIAITAVNDAPVITTTETPRAYVENASTVVDGGITLADADSGNLASATIGITNGFFSGQDRLGFTNQNGILGNWDDQTGVLTLSGSASVADYQAALRSITYSNTSDNPDTTSRTVSFTVSDGIASSNTATRGVTITSVNDAPMAADDTATATEDQPYSSTTSLLANDGDVDGPALGAVAGTYATAQGGSITIDSDGHYTYTASANFNGTDTVDYTLTDGSLTDVGTLTLTVTAVNDAPEVSITPASYSATEKVALTLSGTGISVSDVDAGTAVIRATLSVVSGTLSGVEGSTGVTLAGSGTKIVTLDGTLAQINAFLAGNAGASLSYRIDDDIPPASDTFTLTVDDLGYSGGPAQTGTDTATINITAVSNTNNAPTVAAPIADQGAIEDSLFSFTFPAGTFADADAGDSLSYTTSALPSWLSFNVATRTFSGTPTNADVGPVTITVTATDGSGATTSDSFVLTVANTNDAPTVAIPIADQGATEDSLFSFTFPAGTFSDADTGDSLSYTTSALPSWLSFNVATRTFSGTPANADVGPVTITVTATDLSGATTSDSFVLTVANTNNAPTVASAIADQSATEDAAFSFTLPPGTFSDVDTGDSLSYTTSLLPGWLSFNAATRTFSGTPTNADVGPVTITVTATDLSGATASDSFVLTVANTNNAPTVASPITDQSATEDIAFSFTLPPGTFSDVDTGDSLSYTTSALPSWLSFNAATRTFSGTPANADVGPVTITVTATDLSGATASDSFVLTVANINDAPTVASAIADQDATEDAAFSFTFPAGTFADEDAGDSLSYTTSALPSWLSFDAGTRTFSGTPANADVGSTTITVTATDLSGAQVSDSFVLTVTNTNNAPTVAAPIADQGATEDSLFSFTFPGGTFADADTGDSLIYTTSALPTWLSFNAGTRTFSGTPTNADVGNTTITVTATDGSGATTSDSFVLTVANTNDAPTVTAPIADQSATEDVAFSFMLPPGTFADADTGDSLSYTTSALPGWLSFNAGTRTFSGTPTNADVGNTTITVTATDLSGATASDSFVLTVANTNNAPTVASAIADQGATEDSLFSFTFPADTFADADTGDSLSYTTSLLPGWLSFDAGTRTFSGTPTNADVGNTTITVTATDVSGATASDSFVLTVANTNDAPTVTAPIADQSATEDVAFSFMLPPGTFADADTGDSLSYTTSALPGWLSFNAGTRTFSGTPTNADVGNTTITVTATDGSGAQASDSFVLTVANTNDAPTVAAPIVDQDATEDAAFSFTFPADTFADADASDSLSYTTSALPNWLSFNAGTRTFSGTPTNADVGPVTITVTATDLSGATASDSFVLTVANTNNAPTVAAPIADQDATEDAAFSFTLPPGTFADADAGDSLSYTTSALPGWLSFNVATRTFSGTPANADVGNTTITVTATDLSGATSSDSFALTVANTNDAPTVATSIADQGATEDAVFSFSFPADTFADADTGDSLSYTTSALPSWLSFNAGTRTFSGTPSNAGVGNTTITVTATDLSGATASDSFVLTVANTNNAPTVAAPIADQSATEDVAFSFTLPPGTFADADTGDSLSYTTSALPSWLSFDAGTRTLSGTPTNADVGPVTITVTATDLSGATASDSFVLTMNNTNDPPIALADTVITAEDTPLSFDPVANDIDPDGDVLTLASVTQGAHGLVSLVGGAILYTPDADFNGADSFTYTISDGQGGSTTATVSVTVTPVNDMPQAADDAMSVAEDEVLAGSVAANDSPSGDGGNVWRVVAGPSHGSLVLAGDGGFRYTPAPDFHGADGFTYTLTDADGDSVTATAAIVVTLVNDAPEMIGGASVALHIAENTTAVATLGATDADMPAQVLRYGIVGGADQALFSVDAVTGVLRFTAPPDHDAPADSDRNNVYELIVEVSDGIATASQTLAITVDNRNEMPRGSDGRIGMDEDGSYRFTLGDFGFHDDLDSPANSLAAVQLVALPGPGVLQLAGRGVAAGEWVAAGDIAAGRLSYQPAPDANGSGYASLLFRVRDNGGTAGGGIDTEAGTHTLSIDVAAVNDAPVISLVAFELPPGTGVVLGAGSIVVSDVDSSLATLEYVVEVASAGHFERVGAPGQAILGFSQADLLAGRVVFVRDLAEATPVVVLHARDAQAGSSAVTATITVQESAPGGGAGPVLTPTEPPASTSMPPEPPVRSVTSPEPPASTATPVVTKPAEAEKITKTPTTINRPGLPDGLAPEINPVSPGDGPLTLARDAAGNSDPASRARNQTVGGTLRFDRAPVRLSLDGGLDGPLLDFMLRGDGLVSTSTGTSAGLRGADSNLREGLQGKDGEVDVRVVLQAIELTGVALSVGAVWWATRAGALVASLLVSVPAWRSFDPLMVLGPEDEGDRDWAGVMDDQAVRDEMGIAGVFDAKIGEARS